jgi:phage terminase large subunit-like protein
VAVDATILEVIRNQDLWKPWFKDTASWEAWEIFLGAMFGLPLGADALSTFTRHTGRSEPRPGGYSEAWLVVGRRGGKSLLMGTIACYLAIFRDWSSYLVPGESALIQVLASDRRQARIVYNYCRAMLTEVPVLKPMVVREQDDRLELSNGLAIEITTNNFRSVRGYTVVACLLDEVAFWRSEDSTNPDFETLTALRPAMATVPGSILIGASC